MERVLRTATPALFGFRDCGIEEEICRDLGVDPDKYLAPTRSCGCRRSLARATPGWLMCRAYDIPQLQFPLDWRGGYHRPSNEYLARWRASEELDVPGTE